MNVLVVAAHPDDEVLGAGATMARLADEGHVVTVLILAQGVTSRSDAGGSAEAALEHLRQESRQAARVLGVDDVVHADYPDNQMDTVPLLEVVKRIEEVSDRTRPEVVLCQSGRDVNVDHRRVFQAVLAATRPQPGHHVRSVLAFEVPSSTEWAFEATGGAFAPTVFYDVSAHVDRKLEALAAYRSELRDAPHPRSLDHVERLLRVRGAAVGVVAAEAFEIVREVR